jgi:hypothetical protein
VTSLTNAHHFLKRMLGILNVLQQMTAIDEVKLPALKGECI